MKVMVVDDNRDDRMVLRCVVEQQGHEAIEAENGQEALDLLASQRPDLIISDALMPVMDGFQFLKQVKEDAALKTIPFIFYSATYQEDRDVALAASLGAETYIFKPKDPVELWSEVEAVLQQGSAVTKAGSEISDLEYLKKYSSIIATKLEEKVAELEKALAVRAESEKALRRAKEEWERSFEAISDVAMILSPDLAIVRANRQAYETLAAEPDGTLEGKFCYEVFHKQDVPCSSCPVDHVRQTAQGHTREIVHDPLGRTFQVSISPVTDEDGTVASFVLFAKDVTAQKELEFRLTQAQKLEAIGTLAGGIAHDFNNILTPILGYAEMVKATLTPGNSSMEFIDEVIRASIRAKDLVGQILAFSRQKEQQLVPMELHPIIKEAVKLLRASIPASIEIRTDIEAGCGMILADATEIHQIVMNLCTNAYHAMRDAGGILAVTLRPVRVGSDDPKVNGFALTPGRYVVLSVSDTGCGMDKETLPRIFDPYFTTKKKGEGTGLGLSVVHGIIKKYGGHVSVYSEVGQGTTFRIYLPNIASAGKEEGAAELQPLPVGTQRVLLIDDEQAVVELLTRTLTSLGYRVTGYSGSMDALHAFQTAPREFDLVLTDMTMPVMNGLELSLRIHAIRPEIPIIICTGFSELIDGEKIKEMGIQGFLKKPVLRRDLAETVYAVLHHGEGAE